MTDQTTRRTFVRTVGATLATAALAGCSSQGSGDATTERDGMDDGTTASDSMGDESMENETMGNESMGNETMGNETMGDTTTEGETMGASTLSLDLSNLPDLDAGHYEGWAVFGSEKVSTGTFAAGDETTFEVTERDLSAADEVVVTIEPDEDPSPTPSGVVLLSGALQDGTADLSFPVDFGDASGSYILATPSNGKGDETSGVWFLEPGSTKEASLDLPDLPGGWVYEGWAVVDGTPVSTGRFSSVTGADSHAMFSGDMGTPPFPGEDLLQNAPDGLSFPVDLSGAKVVVSVEPDVDGSDPTGPKPFQVKPLAGTVPADAEPKTSYDLQRKTGTLPSGTAAVM